MISFAYNNRTIRLIKDILFVALGMWLASRASFLAVLVGILAIFWYGRSVMLAFTLKSPISLRPRF